MQFQCSSILRESKDPTEGKAAFDCKCCKVNHEMENFDCLDCLDDLCDMAHQNTLGIRKIENDRQFVYLPSHKR